MNPSARETATRLLEQWRKGNPEAGERLMAATYDELRRLARAYLRNERSGHTLQATALLNEVYLRLIPQGPLTAENREAFFRLMASEMHRRLVDHARRRNAEKRGGGAIPVDIDAVPDLPKPTGTTEHHEMLDRLDAALEQLAAAEPRVARVVRCRYMCGMTTEETAAELQLSTGTVKRDWTFAKAWLAAALDGST